MDLRLYVLVVDVVDEKYRSLVMLMTTSLGYAISSARKVGSYPGDGPRISTVYETTINEHQCEGLEFARNKIVYKVASPRNLMSPCQLNMWPDKCNGVDNYVNWNLNWTITCTCQSDKKKEPYGGIVHGKAAAFAAGAAADLTYVEQDPCQYNEEQLRAHYEQYFHMFMSTHYPALPSWVDEGKFREYVQDVIANDYCTFEDGNCPLLMFPFISNTIDTRSGTLLVPPPSTLYSLFWETECFRIPEPGSNKQANFKMFMNTHFPKIPSWVKADQFRSYMWSLYENLPAPDENGYIQVPQLFFPLISATLDMKSSSSLIPPPVDMYSLFWSRAPNSIIRLEHPNETLP